MAQHFLKNNGKAKDVDLKVTNDWFNTAWPGITNGYKEKNAFSGDEEELFQALVKH